MKAPNKEAVIGCLESGLFRFAFFSLPVSVNSLLYYRSIQRQAEGNCVSMEWNSFKIMNMVECYTVFMV